MFQRIPQRVYIQKKSTGAVWSSLMPQYGIWKKETLGINHSADTCGIGSVTNGNFFPFSRRNKGKFEVI